MDGLRAANLGFRFLLELTMLAAVAWWGWHVTGAWAAAALPIAFALVWGGFLSPKARIRLEKPLRVGLELVVFAIAAAAFYGAGRPWMAVGFAVAAAVHELLSTALRQR